MTNPRLRQLDTRVCSEIESAINQRRVLRLQYGGFERVVEPHLFGVCQGIVRLLCYQVGGGSSSGGLPEWRLLAADGITDCVMLPDSFVGDRSEGERGFTFTDIFAQVS